MKKILLPFDGTSFSEAAFNFARYLHQLQPVKIAGVFIPQVNFSAAWSYAAVNGPLPVPEIERETGELVLAHIQRFETLCKQYGIDYVIHKHFQQPGLMALQKETRFADLLIVSSQRFFEHRSIDFLTNMLHNAECSALVVPENFVLPGHIVLAYDGTAGSVFAIKQFACLLPQLCKHKTTLLYVAERQDETVPDSDYIAELAECHLNNPGILKLDAGTEEEVIAWLNRQDSPLLVAGSFGRTLFSRVFRKSFAEAIIMEYRMPVFIAHK